MRAAIYIRVSTEEQAASGLGLEAQRAACMERARKLGATEVSVFADEGVSGATPVEDRDGLVAALDWLKRGDSLIVAKTDRIGREGSVFIDVDAALRLRKATLVSVAGEGTDGAGAAAFLMRGMMRLLAEYERELIRERTANALQAKRSRGEKLGGAVPFGWRIAYTEIVDGRERKRLVEDAGEQAAIRRIHELHAQGMGVRRISDALKADGIRGRGCSQLSPATVHRILQRDLATAVGAADV
jgi:DNA invertase Pin-like site-specific DNA recombinase